jgi:hypothetical protein
MKLDFVTVFESGPSSGTNDTELPKRRIVTPFPRDWSPHLDSREPGKQIPLLYWIWRFIAILTNVRFWSLSREAQSLPTPL